MATFTSNTSTGYSLVLTVTEASTSVANNTSTVNWSLVMKATTAYCQWNPGAGIVTAYINGQRVYNARPAMVFSGYNSQISIGSGSVTVGHNNYGTKSCGCSASYSPTSSASYLPGSMSLSGNLSLSTIPRATIPSLSASNVTLGNAVTINLPRAASGFTHNVTYQFGNASGTIATGAGTSCSWTPAVTLAQQIPSAVSGTGTITVVTKNGSTNIGTKSISITLTVPSSVVPSISAHTITEATANLTSKFGAYVQSKSTLKVTTTAAGVQGSTIRSIMTVIEGKSYSGSPCTSGTIQGSGTIAVRTTVTDTRGRTASKTTNVTVVAYSPPQITTSNVARTSDESTTATAVYSFSISSVGNKNDHTFYIQYLDGTTWKDIDRNTSDYTKSGSATSDSVFGVDATTKVRFVAQDYFTTATIEKEVGPTFTLINFGAGHKSMALGMISANEGALQVALPFEHCYRTSASGNDGYLKILELEFSASSNYNYGALEFMYHSGAHSDSLLNVGRILLRGSGSSDCSIYLATTSNTGAPFYYVKEGTRKWAVYVGKIGGEQAAIYYVRQYHVNNIKWKFANTRVATLPSGYARARWEHLNDCYPINSIKITTDSTNPGTRLGGTWVQYAQGRVLVGQGTGSDGTTSMSFSSGSTGGEYKHKLTVSEIPGHTHGIIERTGASLGSYGHGPHMSSQAGTNHNWPDTNTPITSTGGSSSHNNVQPYQTVYYWRRTA